MTTNANDAAVARAVDLCRRVSAWLTADNGVNVASPVEAAALARMLDEFVADPHGEPVPTGGDLLILPGTRPPTGLPCE